MNHHSGRGMEPLIAPRALEVPGFLVLDQCVLIREFTVAVPESRKEGHSVTRATVFLALHLRLCNAAGNLRCGRRFSEGLPAYKLFCWELVLLPPHFRRRSYGLTAICLKGIPFIRILDLFLDRLKPSVRYPRHEKHAWHHGSSLPCRSLDQHRGGLAIQWSG